jgi:legumain
MEGNSAAVKGKGTGKVLKSDSNSKVFFFFSDHGAPGLIAFPTKYLYADQFNTILNNMYNAKMYKRMVLYIEACESGSMFDKILSDKINVYAVTASNPTESSWGCYCYPDDEVQGVHMNTCLGDLFSVNWMENADQVKPDAETLE